MKTLIENSTKRSIFLWEDSVVVNQDSSTTTIGDPAEYIVHELNSTNSTIIENVPDSPSDWANFKYKYDNGWKNDHPTDDGKTYKWVPEDLSKINDPNAWEPYGWVPE
jgi:hypothetical protein